ncbi:MAG TPA: LURP-one-related family protein [Nocardioidaceae bacterium]|nr:LURP-one-related family protein [Nocardioidaceae bacterium]
MHYKMRQRLLSIGDDFWIETDGGEKAYKVDGKALRLRKTLVFEDADGHELAKIRQRVARLKDSVEVEDPDGNRLAMVKKALVSPVRDRWSVQIGDGPDLEVHGNVVDHEYTFTDGRTPVATVSKKWFRIADTYGVEIAPDRDPVTVLAATVAIDLMAHESR